MPHSVLFVTPPCRALVSGINRSLTDKFHETAAPQQKRCSCSQRGTHVGCNRKLVQHAHLVEFRGKGDVKTMNMMKGLQEDVLTENSMFFLSWLTALGSGTGSVCLMTDTDSPEEERCTARSKGHEATRSTNLCFESHGGMLALKAMRTYQHR